MKIAISTESTADFSKELIEKYDINSIPLFVRLGEEEFLDGTFPCSQIFEYVKKSKLLPQTSAQNEQNYIDYFQNILKDNDAVIHFSISKELSSSYINAKTASEKLENVYVVDTRALSTGIALLCIYAKKLADENLPIKEIVKKVEERIPSVQVSFIITELNYLYKGGRCSGLAFLGSNILKIRPQIIMKNGNLHPNKKFIGSADQATLKYVKTTLEEYNTPDLENIFITYTTCKPEIEAKIIEILKQRGFKNIYVTHAGATITSHCGENCVGILYINDGRQ